MIHAGEVRTDVSARVKEEMDRARCVWLDDEIVWHRVNAETAKLEVWPVLRLDRLAQVAHVRTLIMANVPDAPS